MQILLIEKNRKIEKSVSCSITAQIIIFQKNITFTLTMYVLEKIKWIK